MLSHNLSLTLCYVLDFKLDDSLAFCQDLGMIFREIPQD
nr:unnamed protein product [Callosobruchus chinensis]